MATYGVRYYEAGQRAVFEAELEASSEDALRADAAAAGRIILGLHRHSGARAASAGSAAARFDIAAWCRELATLLGAGMTVVEALETLAAQARGTSRETVHAGLLRSLQEGLRLSRAMQRSGSSPPSSLPVSRRANAPGP